MTTARQTHYSAAKLGRVLLADDELLVGRSLKASFERANIDCDCFQDIESAIAALKKTDYHAIVADVFFAGKPEGLKLISAAKEYGIPSIVITAALNMSVAKEALNDGADHLFEKPFPAEELIRQLVEIWENPRGLISRRERFFSINQLTERERSVTRLILKGLSNQEIAEVEDLTLGTVKFYSSQIFEKCGVSSRAELFNTMFPT